MYSKRYSQCGFPLSGWGLNLSNGSIPYTQLPKHYIYLISITLDGTVFEIDEGFETISELFRYLDETFVPNNSLTGYFFTTQYHEFIYSNEENFVSGSFLLSSIEEADTEFDLTQFYPSDFA